MVFFSLTWIFFILAGATLKGGGSCPKYASSAASSNDSLRITPYFRYIRVVVMEAIDITISVSLDVQHGADDGCGIVATAPFEIVHFASVPADESLCDDYI